MFFHYKKMLFRNCFILMKSTSLTAVGNETSSLSVSLSLSLLQSSINSSYAWYWPTSNRQHCCCCSVYSNCHCYRDLIWQLWQQQIVIITSQNSLKIPYAVKPQEESTSLVLLCIYKWMNGYGWGYLPAASGNVMCGRALLMPLLVFSTWTQHLATSSCQNPIWNLTLVYARLALYVNT